MKEQENSKIDQLLDLLLDALQERKAVRAGEPLGVSREQVEQAVEEIIEEEPEMPASPPPVPADITPPKSTNPIVEAEPAPVIPEKLPTIHLDQLLKRLTIALVALVVIVNIPFNRYGTNLARAMPDAQALIIRDGLVLKGDGDEIYVLENNQKRWISSLDAFTRYGYRWEQVNQVDDAFLAQFPTGPTLSILYKCTGIPHVYAYENGEKRWIKDIPTFEAQGYKWEDVQIISCTRLDKIPSGLPIPPDAGKPPGE